MKHFAGAGWFDRLVPANTANAVQQKQQETNSYEQNKAIRAIKRQRQCRSRRPAHFSEQPGSGCQN
jgi:hypothetical protein